MTDPIDPIDEALDKMEDELNQPPVVGVVIDKSGSMGPLQAETISGFNEFLEEQKRHSVRMAICLFDTNVDLHPIEAVGNIAPLDRGTYQPGGMTALLDAIGATIAELDKHPQAKKVVCIITDGAENASVQYAYDQIRDMVEDRQTRGWDFLFLGAGLDAMKEAGKIGVSAASTASYSHTVMGTQSAHAVMSSYATRSYTGDGPTTLTDEELDRLQNPDE